MLKRLLLLLIFLYPGFLLAQTDDAPRDTTLRVLSIGNSFSIDANLILPQVVVDAGVPRDNFVLYATIYAGASLEYWDNMYTTDTPLPYVHYMGGKLLRLEDKEWTLRTLLQSQPWDVVVIQQASALSTNHKSFQPYMNRMIEYIRQDCPNKHVRIGWQLTWSYPQTATSGPVYEEGWRKIAMIANQKCHDAGIDFIIPSGTAIQNARTTELGENSNGITRDGLHLSFGVGVYIAAMTWYESIFRPIYGKSIIGVPVSKAIKDCDRGKEGFQEITDENYLICQQCVKEAVSDPLHLMTDPVDERPVFYEVSFEANGQTTIQYLPKDSLIPEPAIPAAPTGYHFAGWNPAYDTTSTVPQWGIHYQIVWKPNDYSFSFDSNGGTAVDTLTQTYDNAFVPPADPSRTGYTFLGWQPALPDSVPAADMTFTAQWQVNTYTLAFDANGGTPVDTIVQNYDTALAPPADPSRTGYTFLGWEPALPDSIPPYDANYTAQWQVNTYTLAFDANGGTPVDTIVQNYDTALVPPANPSRTGYTFLGWEPALPDSIPPYDITYTAQWQVNAYALSFDSDGGTPVDTIVQNYDTALVPPAVPVRTGHLFAGWMPALPDSIPPHDAHYVAMWQRCDYTLQFDTDGGSALSPLRSPYGAALVPPSPPQREGFNFLGWDPQIPTYMPASDLACKARWERAEFTLTFDSNQGSSVTAISQLYDTPLTPPEPPVRHGYTFCGWQPPLPERMPAASITHHAVWEAQQFLVRYFVGDSLVHQDSVAFEAPIPPFTPTLSETYVWKGWQEALPYWMPCHPLDFHAVLVHRLLYRFGGRADVYSPQGCLILRQADTEAIRRLTPGPYIIGGMKVWLK
ncbi:MAG: InlB B-repeat-containing protein [Bacteroidales bacterium]|nr:InlB B-repeat-containing protein [Bacteroidales bacterium]MDY2704303.1 InlB B-repeat-containing protein [Alloprevotella sp.]